MSQDFLHPHPHHHHHQGIENFGNGFERSASETNKQLGGGGGDDGWISQRGEMIRFHGSFDSVSPAVAMEVSEEEHPSVYDAAGMLTEMITLPGAAPGWRKAAAAATGDMLIDNHHHHHHQIQSSTHRWLEKHHHQEQSSLPLQVINHAELTLMNPKASPPRPPPAYSLQMLLPNTSDSTTHLGSITTDDMDAQMSNNGGRGFMGHHHYQAGLSLSLSSSFHNLHASASFEDLKMGTFNYYNQINNNNITPSNSNTMMNNYNNLNDYHHQQQQQPVHVGFATSQTVMMNPLKNSRYLKPAQQLLEEFCCVRTAHFMKNKTKNHQKPNNKMATTTEEEDEDEDDDDGGGGNPISSSSAAAKDGAAASSAKDRPPLSAGERSDYQRKKNKLISMLDEIDGRYARYCEQIQAMVNSFDSVVGSGAAAPYTVLAQKAMSRHFRCIKDAIIGQLKLACEALGEKDCSSTSGLTKGETPRLRLLEQRFRRQKALQQMGMLDSDAWRPQRGLPEQSINILRSWLFDHFLHPYPSEADKHYLSRQTGLSKNQVSNWFINARVRLWKPMVEEMYQQELKDADVEEQEEDDDDHHHHQETTRKQEEQIIIINNDNINNNNIVCFSDHAQTSMSCSSSRTNNNTTLPPGPPPGGKRLSDFNSSESDPTECPINFRQYNTTTAAALGNPFSTASATSVACHGWRVALDEFGRPSPVAQPGDVSLSLGLKYPESITRKNHLSINDFGAY